MERARAMQTLSYLLRPLDLSLEVINAAIVELWPSLDAFGESRMALPTSR